MAAQGFDDVILKPICDLGTKLMAGQIIVSKDNSSKSCLSLFIIQFNRLRKSYPILNSLCTTKS